MKGKKLHPRDELAMLLARIYRYKMTTTSGGNLSVKDANGDIWITPAAVDKGLLKPNDIVCVRRDGSVEGLHPPSSEFPFHQSIYDARPDVRAIIHAHPPALVAFSSAHKIPDTRMFPAAWRSNRSVGFAPYGTPGSSDLGVKIAEQFGQGFNSVILENHGVCCGGISLSDALMRFETLELCAQTIIKAYQLGEPIPLSSAQLPLDDGNVGSSDQFVEQDEIELRNDLAAFVQRGYRQRLLTGATGVFSARIDAESFLMTPPLCDHCSVTPEDLVVIKGDTMGEDGAIHQAIYAAHPTLQSIVSAQSTHILAFSLCHQNVDTAAIPESYAFVGEVALIPFDAVAQHPGYLASVLSPASAVAMIENNGAVIVGESLLQVFDRLEVLETVAESILAAKSLGGHIPLGPSVMDGLRVAFNL